MRVELPPRARRILERSVSRRGLHGTTSACAENTWYTAYGWFQNRNYLRVRGEYRIWIFPTCAMMELPPRARRIHCRCICKHTRRGTTSACAENTLTWGCFATRIRNYLRVRGEYACLRLSCARMLELPPRARRIRFKPSSPSALMGNYLRVRGEYLMGEIRNQEDLELPPRARRIPQLGREHLFMHGTTSACAENTNPGHRTAIRLWNYLRVRGEYATIAHAPRPLVELPPRARRIRYLGV